MSLSFNKGHFSLDFEIIFQNMAVTLPADCVDVSIQQQRKSLSSQLFVTLQGVCPYIQHLI